MMTIREYAEEGKPCWIIIDPPFGGDHSGKNLINAFQDVCKSERDRFDIRMVKVSKLTTVLMDREYVTRRVLPDSKESPKIVFGEYSIHLTP